jgi:hypothetical protein
LAAPEHGDVLIRRFVGSSLQVVDARTLEQICIVPSVDFGIRIAADRRVAVWRENVDHQGNPMGAPTLLWRRTCAVPPDLAAPGER